MRLTTLIQVLVEEDTEFGWFRDSLYYRLEEHKGLSEADIEAVAQARVDAWVEQCKNPPVPVEPTREELEQRLVRLDQAIEADARRRIQLVDTITMRAVLEREL